MFLRRSKLSKPRAANPAALVRRRPRSAMSLTGGLYTTIMLFMALAAMQNRVNVLFGIVGLMIGVLLVSGFISHLVLRRLRVRRILPEHGVVGRTMRAVYEITNRKRFWPSFAVSLAELDGVEGFEHQPQCYLLHVAAGMTASVPADLVPRRRGLHKLDRYQIVSGFPFGFMRSAAISSHTDRVLIYPAQASVDRRLIAMCRSAETTGAAVRPTPGGNDEFYGVKDFRSGENARRIYWRRSARTGALIAKEMTRVAPPRLLLLVDTFTTDASADDAELIERAIAMAASLASTALEQGMSVGLIAWGNSWLSFAPARGKQQRTELLSALARLPINRESGLPSLLEECEALMRPGVTPVLFTPQNVQLGLGEEVRGDMVIVSSAIPSARAWFSFEKSVDFRNCVPMEQGDPARGKAEN
jgi:uncharacterized protein (DUF58 family)